tara:strand:- start:100 stop:291 length:192 start_codon:yes stop_codon:yes gene_type:complete
MRPAQIKENIKQVKLFITEIILIPDCTVKDGWPAMNNILNYLEELEKKVEMLNAIEKIVFKNK